jgi:hypothetical protein
MGAGRQLWSEILVNGRSGPIRMIHNRQDDTAVFQFVTDVPDPALNRIVVVEILSHLEWDWQLYDTILGRDVLD